MLLAAFGVAVIGAIKGTVIAFRAFVKIVSGVMNIISGIFTGDWARVWEGAKQVVTGVLGAILGPVRAIGNGIVSLLRGAGNRLKTLWTALWAAIKAIVGRAVGAVRGVVVRLATGVMSVVRNFTRILTSVWRAGFNRVTEIVRGAGRAIKTEISAAMILVRGVIPGALTRIKTIFRNAWGNVREVTATAFRLLKGKVGEGIGDAVDKVKDFPRKAKEAIGDLGGTLFSAGAKLVQGLIDGIASKIRDLTDKMGDLAGKVKGFLPGSPIKTGPLTSWNNGGAGIRLIETLAYGLSKTTPIDNAMDNLTGRMQLGTIGARVDLASDSIGGIGSGGIKLVVNGPVPLRVGDREMQAWFEDSFDAEVELAGL